MELRRTESGFRVVDSVSTSLDVETDGWAEADDAPAVTETLRGRINGPDDPASVVSGQTRGFVFPNVLFRAVDLDDDTVWNFSATTPPETLPHGRYLLQAETSIRAFLQFTGQPEIRRVGNERVEVTFPEETDVSVAFEESIDDPPATITVPKTLDGVATGLSMLCSTTDVTTADRSWPSVRNHPPLLQFGEERRVPDSIRAAIPDTGIELAVPRDLQYVLTSASLSFYLGAAISLRDDCEPRLDLDGRSVRLGETSPVDTHDSVSESADSSVTAYASRCVNLLRRIFFSDCLIREASPYGGSVVAADPESDLGLDSAALYDATIPERVCRYLDAPFDAVSDSLPGWSFALSVRPRYDVASTLSRVAHTLPAIAPADGETVPAREAIDGAPRQESTLRTDRDPTSAGGVQTSEPHGGPAGTTSRRIRPNHRWGRTHGWLADGIPVEGFDALDAGFTNRDRFAGATEDTPTVSVVVNGTDDHRELSRAVDHYRRRTAQLDLDVSIQTDLSVAELARAFERKTDLLHFVGHREDRGFECRDGYFSTETLTTSNVRTFFLNACNSHPAGVDLVEKGSVAGGVTTRDVIDEMAAEVGVRMAQLLVDGFTVADAMAEARRDAVVPSDYLVVGDGTHVVTQSGSLGSKRLTLTPLGDGESPDRFELSITIDSPTLVGTESTSSLDEPDGGPHLFGTTRQYELSRGELRAFLSNAGAPIRYERELLTPDALTEQLFD